MTDAYTRPYSTSSLISPHDALEALAARDKLDLDNFPPSPDEPISSPSRRTLSPNGTTKPTGLQSTPRANGRAPGVPPQTPPIEDQFIGRNFVRAVFDFEATDPSALSFRAGDIIEVITQLESGWWDGLLGRERGWFPSNYVQAVNPREILDQVELEEDDDEPRSSTSGTSGSGTMRGAQSGHVKASGSGSRLSNIGEDMGLDWNRDDFSGSVGLGDLAREMMGNDEEDDFVSAAADRRRRMEQDQPDEFAAAAEDRKRRQERAMEGEGTPTMDDFSPAHWGRRRHQTDDTLRGVNVGLDKGLQSPRGKSNMDAWIPSMTPDGQVYYHNELTGEDAWEMPIRLDSEGSDTFEGDDDDFFNSFAQPPSSSGPSPAAYARPPSTSTEPDIEMFQAPPKSLPEPWTAKMMDDGRGWYYVNSVTGHTRRNPPSPTLRNINDDLKRLSVASIPPPAPKPLRHRRSLDLQIRQVEQWSNRTRDRMAGVVPAPPAPTMGHLVEVVNECLREVFESCVAGSAAEEELSRADDLGSDAGVTLALAREEAAEEMLKIAHLSTLASIRELFTAFGYVGPLEPDTKMPRPKWVGDMTLIGSIGLLSANVHAATTSHRIPDSGLSVWAEVMRAASKLKDVIALFPGVVTPNVTVLAQEGAEGKSREAKLQVHGAGRMFGGRWGFGRIEGRTLRALDQNVVSDLEKVKVDFDRTDSPVDAVRQASAFRELLLSIDLASSLDIDGDTSSGAKEENARTYANLVADARNSLEILDEAETSLARTCESVLRSESMDSAPDALLPHIGNALQSISTLLGISSSQRSMNDQSLVLGQYGHRSPSFVRPERPPSIVSAKSRLSRLSMPRRPARGLEEEFLESGEFDDELRDQAGELVSSTSGSQTSLPQMGRRGIQVSTQNNGQHPPGPGEISATSSTTSLTYQKSDGDTASQKGKRSSIMKFMRGRSGSDADDGRITTKPRQASKKLAKLLGEDINTLGQLPPPQAPPAQQVPETPWYLGDDYEPSELLFDDKGAVRAGSLRALVARLTPYGSTDTSFFQAFMFTFRSFTTGQELLENLLQRYYIEPPAGLTPVEVADWTKQKQTPLRLRVCNTLRAWLDKYYVDKMDRPLLDRLERFAEDESRMLAAQQLKGLVQRRRRGEVDTQRRIVSGALLSPPAPLIPRVPAGREMNVLDIAPLELARQLTILESGFFQRVQPSECLNKSWNGPDGDKLAPNVRSVIKTANILSGWVGTTCLSSRDAKQRARIMKHFIQTAMELRNLNNFSSMAAVAAGLNTAPVLRLKRSWELCSPKTQAQKAEVDKTLDSTKNFSNYKDMLKTINPPCVPFFGFWLSALTFIEDGNKDFVPASIEPTQPGSGISISASSSSLATRPPISAPLPSASSTLATSSSAGTPAPEGQQQQQQMLINFFKRSLAAEILRDIQQYQSQPYNLAKSRMVYDWLMKQLEYCDRTYDLDKLYNLSLQLEPREREEERITRMLHDSGFI